MKETEERYASWFRYAVESGWICGLYHPQEILANYVRTFHQLAPYTETLPYEHIERFMIDTTRNDWMVPDSEVITLQQAVTHFNQFYKDGRMEFGIYTRLGELDATTQGT